MSSKGNDFWREETKEMLASGELLRQLGDQSMPARLQPENIQAIGGELAIAWSDGVESYLPLEPLRRACPCAGCGGEPDVLGQVIRPEVSYTSRSFELAGWQLIGGYALQPRWGDGHNTGLYSFAYLRRLAEEQHTPTPAPRSA